MVWIESLILNPSGSIRRLINFCLLLLLKIWWTLNLKTALKLLGNTPNFYIANFLSVPFKFKDEIDLNGHVG